MDTKMMFVLMGGFGLFFYGMKLLTSGLQRAAGAGLKKILKSMTKSPLRGVFAGALITGIIQSSSATTVLVVGFINAHLMTLSQAIGVIFGANIGTTITAQILAFKITKYALPILFIGVMMNLFVKDRRIKKWADILIGFGMLFYGIHLMKDAFGPLKHSEEFRNLFVMFGQRPIIGIATGAILTAVIQSSSASIGIVLGLAAVGLVDLNSAFALVLGDNIGTTITAQIAAINGSIGARRAAWVHTIFNVVGSLYMYLLLFVPFNGHPIFLHFINRFTPGDVFSGENVARHIANSHTVFNFMNVFVFFPFIPFFEKLVVKIVPGEDLYEQDRLIEVKNIELPDLALEQITKEIHDVGKYAMDAVELALESLYTKKDNLDRVMEMEQYIDDVQVQVTDCIVNLQRKELTEEVSKKSTLLLHVVNDMEKIGDYAENIAKLVSVLQEQSRKRPPAIIDEIKAMHGRVLELVGLSLKSFIDIDKGSALRASNLEGEVDKMKMDFRDNHVTRLGKECSVEAGVIYVDIVSNLERVADHAYTIAKLVLMDIYK
jgi:phosphate:Na+ symporter